MENKKKLEQEIEIAVEQIVMMVESGFSKNLLRPALRGTLKGIAVIAQQTEPYTPNL